VTTNSPTNESETPPTPPVNGTTPTAPTSSPPTTRPPPTPNQVVLAYLLAIALGALACLGIGLLTSRPVGVGAFAVMLLFTITYRGSSKTRAHRAPPPPAPLPAARLEVRGVTGHAQRAGAKLKHATITALVVVLLVGGVLGALTIAAKLKKTYRRPTALERQLDEQRRRDAEREARERRCPGISNEDTCQRYEQFQHQLDERRRQQAGMSLEERFEDDRRRTEELRRKYPPYFEASSEPEDDDRRDP
jgi:hypothetical protein